MNSKFERTFESRRASSGRQLAGYGVGTLLVVVAASAAWANDWPGLLGPGQTGGIDAAGVFEGEGVGLEVAWHVPLSNSYAGLVISGDHLFTMTHDERSDLAVAINAVTGRDLWRREIGTKTNGHDGSDDGPLATPLLVGDTLFVIGSTGDLVALDARNGNPRWRVSLAETLGVVAPTYGYSSSPALLEGKLIVATPGSERGSLAAFDIATGQHLWSALPGKADYQSPTVGMVAGQAQALWWMAERVAGVGADGVVLWTHDTANTSESASAIPFGENGVLLYGDRASVALRIEHTGNSLRASELWQSRALKGANTSPVYYDDHFYGYDRRFLTCIDAATGEQKWKSRPPGGAGLIRVDDRLVVFADDGDVVLVHADPAGYREEARIAATERAGVVWPSFAAGKIFVRDNARLAAVRVTDSAAPIKATELPLVEGTVLARFVHGALARPEDERQAWVEHFFRRHERFPLRETGTISFIYRGLGEDVGLRSSLFGIADERPLSRLQGTDFWYRTEAVSPNARVEYLYRPDFGNLEPDPLNARRVPGFFSAFASESAPTDWSEPDLLVPFVDENRGTLEQITVTSAALGGARNVDLYTPHGWKLGSPARLLVVVQGPEWKDAGQLTNTLDHLHAMGLTPTVAAFVDAAKEEPWREDDGTRSEEFARFLGEELLPALAPRLGGTIAPQQVTLLAKAEAAPGGLLTALRYPRTFGNALLYSYAGTFTLADPIAAELSRRTRSSTPSSVELVSFRHDYTDGRSGMDAPHATSEMLTRLTAAGIEARHREVDDSFGWGRWRIDIAEFLRAH